MKSPCLRKLCPLYLGFFFLLSFSVELTAQGRRLDSTYFYTFQGNSDSLLDRRSICTFENYSGQNDCFNFSSCLTSKWEPFERIWLPESRENKRIENKGEKEVRTLENWDTETQSWLFSTKTIQSNLKQENHLQYFRWNDSLLSWILLTEALRRYDEEGNEIYYENKTRSSLFEKWTGQYIAFTYDELNRRTSSEQANWDGEKFEWQFLQRYETEFDANGNTSKLTSYSWLREDEDWRANQITYSTYNSANQIILRVFEDPNFGAQRITETSYNASGLIAENIRSFKGGFGMNPVPTDRTTFSYTSFDKPAVEERYKWDEQGASWRIFAREEVSYDSLNFPLFLLAYEYSVDSAELKLKARQNYVYSASGNLLDEEILSINTSGLITSGSKVEIDYDNQDRRIRASYWTWDQIKQEFIPTRRSESPYGPPDRVAYYAAYVWDVSLETWMGTGLFGNNFNPDGELSQSYRGAWNPNTEQWVRTESYLYFYGACRVELASSPPENIYTTYPNPVIYGDLFIQTNQTDEVAYSIFDLQGNLLREGTIPGPIARINISSLSAGMYLLRLNSSLGEELQKIQVIQP
ncbi:MAG: T9SS type A sorting domain-containing protein [Bacteroidota bacterium]